jgi:uncharacterized protein (DUF1778 family)
MARSPKTAQLQIRVSPAQKAAIARLARLAGRDMSSFVLARVLPPAGAQFAQRVAECASGKEARFALAALNTYLASQPAAALTEAVTLRPHRWPTDPVTANRIAAMVELACARHGVRAPAWLADIEPLATPVFDSTLKGLRLHLLSHAPPPFRRRNLFVDASVGDQV